MPTRAEANGPWSYWEVRSASGQVVPDSPLPCRPPQNVNDIEVFFVPGDLPPADAPYYRAAVQRALQTWNEESLSLRTFRLSSATAPTNPSVSQIVIRHTLNQETCGDNSCMCDSLAGAPGPFAVAAGGGVVSNFDTTRCFLGRTITVRLRSCDLSLFHYTPGWERQYATTPMPLFSVSYESMILHELGHAGFGFTHAIDAAGVMFNTRTHTGDGSKYLHLFHIDQRSSIEGSATGSGASTGVTAAREWTRALSGANGWVTGSAYPLDSFGSPAFSSFGPGLNRRAFDPGSFSVAVATTELGYSRVGTGGGSSWSYQGLFSGMSPVATAPSSPYPPLPARRSWVRVAVSDFNETLAAWPECPGPTNCELVFAWRGPSSSTWITRRVAFNTFAPVDVEYDDWLDCFVVSTIGLDGRIYGAHLSAWDLTSMTSIYPMQDTPFDDRRFRYLGGMQFAHPPSPPPAPQYVDVHGWFSAALADPDQGVANRIVSYIVRWNPYSQKFDLGSYVSDYLDVGTVRHFEVTRRPQNDEAVTAFLDPDLHLRVAYRTTFTGWYGPSQVAAWSGDLHSSVSIAASMHAPYELVVGVAGVTP